MTREEAEKISAELVAKGMAEADAYIAAARAMLAALEELVEAAAFDLNINQGNDNEFAPGRWSIQCEKAIESARAAIAQAKAAGIKAEG